MTPRCRVMGLALLLVLMSGSLALAGKQKIAVLGLEVKHTGSIDQQSTVVAHDLTEGLRTQAKSGTGPFVEAANSEQELIDQKVMHSCDDERPGCMIEIATDLKADYLMYGSITIESDKGQNVYHVTVTLLAVNKKGGAPQSVSEFFPVKEAREDKLKGWARKAYKKLTGQESSGTLVVKANVDGATVLVDREPRGTIKNGSATLQLDENRYNVAIEAEGYKRYEFSDPITIRAGDTTTKDAELEKRGPDVDIHEVSGTVTHESSHNGLKIATIAGLGVGVALGVVAGVEWLGPVRDYENDVNREGPALDKDGKALDGGDCGRLSLNTGKAVTGNVDTWVKACRAQRVAYIAGGLGILAGTIGVVSGILWLRGGGSHDEHAVSKVGKIAVTPVVTPTVAGATLQIDW